MSIDGVTVRALGLSLIVSLLGPGTASAQNWSFDARAIGMGSPGSAENVATRMIDDEREYRSIVLPFGLLQVLRDFDRLDPTKDDFDIVRAIEYAASPLHYTVGRDTTDSGQSLVVDVRNATVSRDLNRYRGFVPANQPRAEGLASPNWGGTIKVKRGGGAFQGIYVGAGPYFSMQTDVQLDQQLLDVLGSSSPTYLPNRRMNVGTTTRGQLALAVTGGYRGRFAFSNAASARDGVYVALNYNYLRGFDYEDVDLALRLDTDAAGLLTAVPTAPSPLVVTRRNSSTGTGRAVDFGIGFVSAGWEAGFGVRGIGNQIDWTDVEHRTYSLTSLFLGNSDFVESAPLVSPDVSVSLPVDYRGSVGYVARGWSATAEAGQGFGGTSFRGGYEYRLGGVHLRAGGAYVRELWNPAAGIGLPLGGRLALDLAVFSNTANVERKRLPAIAASLRLMRGRN